MKTYLFLPTVFTVLSQSVVAMEYPVNDENLAVVSSTEEMNSQKQDQLVNGEQKKAAALAKRENEIRNYLNNLEKNPRRDGYLTDSEDEYANGKELYGTNKHNNIRTSESGLYYTQIKYAEGEPRESFIDSQVRFLLRKGGYVIGNKILFDPALSDQK